MLKFPVSECPRLIPTCAFTSHGVFITIANTRASLFILRVTAAIFLKRFSISCLPSAEMTQLNARDTDGGGKRARFKCQHGC